MIKLSDRLQIIAAEIKQNETMADIGTDHGFLPIYLWENHISPKIIMADLSQGSLEKARENCTRYYPDMDFDLRLGDGITILDNDEVDAVVIAGMGGILMTEILEEYLPKSYSFSKFILQPRNRQGKLRKWLITHGFAIINESLVREGKYICEVITAVPRGKGPEKQWISQEMKNSDDIYYEVPPWIWKAGPLAEEFIMTKLGIEEDILRNMGKSTTVDEVKVNKVQKRIEYLNRLLKGDESYEI